MTEKRLLADSGRVMLAAGILLICALAFSWNSSLAAGNDESQAALSKSRAGEGDSRLASHAVEDAPLDERIERLEAAIETLQAEQRVETASWSDSTIDDVDTCDDCTIAKEGYLDGRAFERFVKRQRYPEVSLHGFFQADWGWFNQDLNNLAAVGDVQNGGDFRRTRLLAKGDVWENVGYMIEMDFAFPGRPSFMDVWGEIRGLSVLQRLRIGQYRQPIGMDALTSVRELSFLERALPFAFLPFRQLGIMAHGQLAAERMTWALSAFRFPTDTFGGNVGDNGGYAGVARITMLPWDEKQAEFLVHLGGAVSYGDPANDRVRYRNQPEFFIGETGGADVVPAGVPTNVPPFVDTGAISTSDFTIVGAEAAAKWRSFYIQSELLYALVDQLGGGNLVFPGMYVHMGYFLTGESRPYKRAEGVFGRIEPIDPFGKNGGWGTWEIATRWSYIDLNDRNITGGRLQNITVGLNWYLNRFTKFQFNYIRAFLATPSVGDSTADIVAARAQVDF